MFLALLADAARQLCSLNILMSTPDFKSSSLIHLDTVSLETGLCGFPCVIKSTNSFRFPK